MGDLEYLSRIANGAITSGVLKNFTISGSGTTLIATVPGGKDWYLMGWSVTMDNVSSDPVFEYPTGTPIDGTRSETSVNIVYNGIAKGNKITATQTVSFVAAGGVSHVVNLFVLEVDIGVSPEIP